MVSCQQLKAQNVSCSNIYCMTTFKPVTTNNLDELLELSKTTFRDAFEHLNNPDDFKNYFTSAFTIEKLRAELKNPDSAFYFAQVDGKNAGYIKLNYASAQTEFKDNDAVEVERIYVLASHQGKQIGKQLIAFAIERAMTQKLRYIWLGVWEHNLNAIRFYEREGFAQFSSHQFVLGKDVQTDILMRKYL